MTVPGNKNTQDMLRGRTCKRASPFYFPFTTSYNLIMFSLPFLSHYASLLFSPFFIVVQVQLSTFPPPPPTHPHPYSPTPQPSPLPTLAPTFMDFQNPKTFP